MKTILISGASGGLGEALSLVFSKKYHILAGVRKAADFERLNAYPNIEAIYLDLSNSEHLSQLEKRLKKVPKLAGLINNAGLTNLSPLEEQPLSEIEQVFETNVIAPIKLIKLCLPRLREVQGQIINIGSTSGLIGAPLGSLYAASKFAIKGLSEALAREVAPQEVTVTHVIPGAIKTNIWNEVTSKVQRKIEHMSPRSFWYYRGFLPSYAAIEKQIPSYALESLSAAKMIESNFERKKPKTQLLIGSSAKLQYTLVRLLPKSLLESILKRRFKSPETPDKDWSALKYFVIEELGEEVDTFMMTSTTPGNIDTIYLRHHAYGDGMAFLTDFFHEQGHSFYRQPTQIKIPKPGYIKLAKLFIEYARLSKGPKYLWNFYERARGRLNPSDHLLIRFDDIATSKLVKLAKAQRVSVTSYLIDHINKVAKELLVKNPTQHTSNWLLPVNFRGHDGRDFDMRNRTTSLCLNLKAQATSKDIDEKIKEQMTAGMPWGAWLHSNIVKIIGLKILTYIYKNIRPSQYLGVFSNLGVWPNKMVPIDDPAKLPFLYIGAPSTSLCPVALVAVTWQGQLSLTIRLHHDFFPSNDGATIFAESIKENILKENGGSASIIKLSAQEVIEKGQRL